MKTQNVSINLISDPSKFSILSKPSDFPPNRINNY